MGRRPSMRLVCMYVCFVTPSKVIHSIAGETDDDDDGVLFTKEAEEGHLVKKAALLIHSSTFASSAGFI